MAGDADAGHVVIAYEWAICCVLVETLILDMKLMQKLKKEPEVMKVQNCVMS